jgi:putative DNA primase/helicase
MSSSLLAETPPPHSRPVRARKSYKKAGGKGSPGEDNSYNDARNAKDFVTWKQYDMRYCVAAKRWFAWNGRLWMRSDGAVIEFAKQFAEEVKRTALDLPDRRDQMAALQRWFSLGMRSKMMNMLAMAESDPRVSVPDVTYWDSDPYTLGVRNGVLNLRTQQFSESDRAARISKSAGVAYDADAKCPKWDAFMEQIMPDEEVRHFLQVSAGYWLTGLNEQQAFWFLYGSGANGKSVFTDVLGALMGDYSRKASATLLAVSPHGTEPLVELAKLPGARFLCGSEVAEGMRLNESIVKDLTGNDVLNACAKYEAPFEYRPACKLVIYGNYKPVIRGTDAGIWRRVRLVPFMNKIPLEQQNRSLGDELKREELPGILNWALRGLADYLASGLPTPRAVMEITESYRKDSDVLGEFIEECCDQAFDVRVSLKELYTRYGEWCKESGMKFPLTKRQLSAQIEGRGYRKIDMNCGFGFAALCLKPESGPFSA